jgi:hypothetical protein
MAQVVEHLPSKHLSSNPTQYHQKKEKAIRQEETFWSQNCYECIWGMEEMIQEFHILIDDFHGSLENQSWSR